ncbi:neuroglian-like [Planococcus citri]|uniref:neuroglian-like n=1 Tax=Planococcus citri TaxID=170843 RepID=UPI0031F92938
MDSTVKLSIFFTVIIISELTGLGAVLNFKSPPIIDWTNDEDVLFRVETEEPYPDWKSFDEKRWVPLICGAKGNPTPEYYWMKNGEYFNWTLEGSRITNPTMGFLNIQNPKSSDAGVYQCFAKNKWGISGSKMLHVRQIKLEPPKNYSVIVKQVFEGELVNFTCEQPDGYPKPFVKWGKYIDEPTFESDFDYLNESDPRIITSEVGNMWIWPVTQEDATKENYTYICVIKHLETEYVRTADRIKLIVLPRNSSSAQNAIAPVKLYTTSENITVLWNEYVSLYCTFGGIPPPKVTWKKDGKIICPSNSRPNLYACGRRKSVISTRIGYANEGKYTCEVSNGIGDPISHTINLKVLAAPYFYSKKSEHIDANENQTVNMFGCFAFGEPTPKITWIYNGKPLSEAPTNPRLGVLGNSSHILIEKVQISDTGNYGCYVTNSEGRIYKETSLNVSGEYPTIEISKDSILETVEGDKIGLRCDVYGYPDPAVKWIRNGAEVTENQNLSTSYGNLTIRNATFADAGEYTIEATNRLSTVNSTINVFVRRRTEVEVEPDYVYKPSDYYATFKCSANVDRNLTPEFRWYWNGTPMNYYFFGIIRDDGRTLMVPTNDSVFSGTYTCEVKTRLDISSANATLVANPK